MLILAGLKLKDLSEQTQEVQPNIKHLDVSVKTISISRVIY